MDFQKLVDSISSMACVISIEKKADGSYGTIRIVTGNKAYIASINENVKKLHKNIWSRVSAKKNSTSLFRNWAK